MRRILPICLSLLLVLVTSLPCRADLEAGDKVEIKISSTSWFPATVLRREGARTVVQLETGGERTVGAGDIRLKSKVVLNADPKFYADLAVGAKVEVDDSGTWRTATILRRQGNSFFIHYDGWAKTWDKWVTPERVRPVGAKVEKPEGRPATKPAAAAAAASGAPPAFAAAEGAVPEPPAAATTKEELGQIRYGNEFIVPELKPDANAPWAVKPDGVKQVALRPLPKPVPPGVKSQVMSTKYRLEVINGTPGPRAWVAEHEDEFIAKRAARDRVARVDLTTGRASPVLTLPFRTYFMGASPDGEHLVARGIVPDEGSWLVVYHVGPAELTPVAVWKHRDQKQITWAAFAGNNVVLSLNEAGMLTGWELPPRALGATTAPAAGAAATTRPAAASTRPATSRPASRVAVARALYRIPFGNRLGGRINPPALSPGGKVLAVDLDRKLMFFDTATGQSLGAFPDLTLLFYAGVSFSPDGTRMTVTDRDRIRIADVATAKVERTVPLIRPFAGFGQLSMHWLESGHLLMDRQYLVDPAARLVIWKYESTLLERPSDVYGGVAYFLGGLFEGRPTLCSATLPHPAALKPPAADAPKIEDLLVFKPGGRVAIVLETDAPEDVRKTIVKGLEEQVRKMGLTPVDGAAGQAAPSVRIIARTQAGETRQRTYKTFDARNSETVTVTQKIQTLIVQVGDQEAWSEQVVSEGGMWVTAKQGQTIADVIREDQAASYSWLGTFPIPPDVVQQSKYKLRGTSAVKANGT